MHIGVFLGPFAVTTFGESDKYAKPNGSLTYLDDSSETNPAFDKSFQDMALKIIIVGAGIAGICAGIALRQAGHQVEVIENSIVWRYPLLSQFVDYPKSDILSDLLSDLREVQIRQ